MKTFKNFLVENLHKIPKRDVDILYKPLIPIVSAFKKAKTRKDFSAIYDMSNSFGYREFSSSVLGSADSKLAHKLNPITIYVHSGTLNQNAYFPSKSRMYVGIHKSAMKAVLFYDILSDNDKKSLIQDFSEIRIKSTIAHEISHWLDDTLNNQHIKKFLSTATPESRESIGIHHIEIQAQVHQINQIRKSLGKKKWNEMSFEELVSSNPTLTLLDKEFGKKWRQIIKKRMAREGILGENMR